MWQRLFRDCKKASREIASKRQKRRAKQSTDKMYDGYSYRSFREEVVVQVDACS